MPALHGALTSVRRRAALLASLVCIAGFRRDGSAFVPAASSTGSPTEGCGHRQEGVLGRRQLFQLAGSVASPCAVAHAKDFRYDSLCTFKCMDQCIDQLRTSGQTDNEYNKNYCKKTCDDYCQVSSSEKDLDEKVKKGSLADKLVQSARKKKYLADKESGEKVGEVDQALGRMFTLVNKTKFKSENRFIGEAVRREK
mmetsp:Transcript_13142/g.30718  ORF Transcript_13142/g.30718 Transcript_13142/m.30718 type:complete len:197 (+) Transcript_13142:68-658(+)